MTTSERQLLPAERHALVLEALKRDGSVRVVDLVAELGVAPVTVRRDIAQLESEGALVRVHGGAVATQNKPQQNVGIEDSTRADPLTVGVVVPTLSQYWPEVIHALESSAYRHGVRLITRASSYEAVDERPIFDRLVTVDQVDGLILAPRTDGPCTEVLAEWLTTRPIPTILMERSVTLLDDHDLFGSVGSDHALGALMAVHHLAQLGHRRVGLVLSKDSPTSHKIAEGWRTGCVELGLTSDEHFEQLTPARGNPEFGGVADQVVDHVLSTGPTGLLVHSDPEAFGVAQAAMERGLHVPGDLSVIAYDDLISDVVSPKMTAVRPPREEVAATAIERVLQRIADPSRPHARTLISPRLNLRESTGTPTATR